MIGNRTALGVDAAFDLAGRIVGDDVSDVSSHRQRRYFIGGRLNFQAVSSHPRCLPLIRGGIVTWAAIICRLRYRHERKMDEVDTKITAPDENRRIVRGGGISWPGSVPGYHLAGEPPVSYLDRASY